MPTTEITSRSISNPLDEAEAKLTNDLRSLETEVVNVKQIIENIRAMRATSRRSTADLPLVRPGQFAGMRTGPALEAYLKQRAGFKIPIDRVVDDLIAGGATLAKKPGRYRQNLKITMQQKRKLVEWDEDWTMWLAATATEAPKPRNVKKA